MRKFIDRESVQIITVSIRKGRWVFILGMVISALGAMTSVAIPLLSKLEIDQLVARQNLETFWFGFTPFEVFAIILLGYFFASFVDKIVTDSLRDFLREREEIFRHEADLFLYERIAKMEIGLTLSSRFHSVMRYVDNKLDDIVNTLVATPKKVLEIIVGIVGITGVLGAFDWRILILVFVGGAATFAIRKLEFQNESRRLYDQKLINVESVISSVPWELRSSLPQLSQNGAVSTILSTLTSAIHEKIKISRPYQKKRLAISWGFFLIDSVISIFIKAGVGYLVFKGTLSVGMVTMSVLYANKLSSIIKDAAGTYFDIRKAQLDLSFFEEFLKVSVPVGKILGAWKISSGVSFEGVAFSYPESRQIERPFFELIKRSIRTMKTDGTRSWEIRQMEEELSQFEIEGHDDEESKAPPVLQNFDFTFLTGKIYGIVGKNGAGKTTLISLISWFFRSYDGRILFNGEDIRHWDNESFSRIISVISQSPYTYYVYGDATVRKNLLLWVDREVSDEEMFGMLKDFHLERKIKKSPHGLNSEIGKDVNFSGWELQLLSIVRTLLQDRPIIVLDEGTNQLDAENEAMVMERLLKRREGKIILFVTHRMNTVSRADEVLCMENGRISVHWKPKALLEAGDNAYAKFYRTQILHEGLNG